MDNYQNYVNPLNLISNIGSEIFILSSQNRNQKIPDDISTLIISEIKLDDCQIPENITSLIYLMNITSKIILNNIPDSLISLFIINNVMLSKSCFLTIKKYPPKLVTLYVNHNIIFNIKNIPSTITKLFLHCYCKPYYLYSNITHLIVNNVSKSIEFPPNLEYLDINYFSIKYIYKCLPEELRKKISLLPLKTLLLRYNNVGTIVIPQSVTKLRIDHIQPCDLSKCIIWLDVYCYIPMTQEEFPPTLKYLTIRSLANQYETIGYLPDSLIYLDISYDYRKNIINKFPSKLEYLKIYQLKTINFLDLQLLSNLKIFSYNADYENLHRDYLKYIPLTTLIYLNNSQFMNDSGVRAKLHPLYHKMIVQSKTKLDKYRFDSDMLHAIELPKRYINISEAQRNISNFFYYEIKNLEFYQYFDN